MNRVQSCWRSHHKPRVMSQPLRVFSHTPNPGTLAQVRQLMKDLSDEAVRGGCARPRYPFQAGEVEAIYSRCEAAEGTWFALHDGRIFSSLGEFCGTDHSGYS